MSMTSSSLSSSGGDHSSMEISLVDWQEVEKEAAKAAHVARQNAKTEHIRIYRERYWCLTSDGSRQGVPKRDWARVTKEEARQRPPPPHTYSTAAAEWWEWYTGLVWQGQAKEQQATYSAAAKSWREKCGSREGKKGYNELRVARRSAARRRTSRRPDSSATTRRRRCAAERRSRRAGRGGARRAR